MSEPIIKAVDISGCAVKGAVHGNHGIAGCIPTDDDDVSYFVYAADNGRVFLHTHRRKGVIREMTAIIDWLQAMDRSYGDDGFDEAYLRGIGAIDKISNKDRVKIKRDIAPVLRSIHKDKLSQVDVPKAKAADTKKDAPDDCSSGVTVTDNNSISHDDETQAEKEKNPIELSDGTEVDMQASTAYVLCVVISDNQTPVTAFMSRTRAADTAATLKRLPAGLSANATVYEVPVLDSNDVAPSAGINDADSLIVSLDERLQDASAAMAVLEEELEHVNQENAELRSRLNACEHERDRRTDELTSLKRELTSAESRLHTKNDAYAQLEEKLASVSQEKHNLQAQLDAYRGAPRAAPDAKASVADALKRLPSSLDEVLTLASALWPDRLYVMPHAHKTAKAFDKGRAEDIDGVWRLVHSIACDLWPLVFESGESVDLEQAYKTASKFTLALRESKTTNKMSGLMAMRDIRDASGRVYTCVPHVKGTGANKNLRIYLCFDRESGRVVIGHAGEHLPTYATRLMK